jgi:hypothetical protein
MNDPVPSVAGGQSPSLSLGLRALRRLLPVACCLLPLATHAGDLLSGRLYTVPERIFVSQAFEIHFELEVTAGDEVEDLRISDFPNDPKLLTLGRLETTSRTSATRGGQSISVLHFVAAARGHQPLEHTFNPRLHCSLVQRRNSGFFSQWQTYPRQLQLAPFELRIQPLPAEGRPEHFSGAVGVFRLTGQISQSTVQPGDIITLTLNLTGQGWLNEAFIPSPSADRLFKTYPPKERLREPLHLQTEQVFIPQSTNATEIAGVRFCFFNPAKACYEESVAGPFKLTFSDQAAGPKTEEVRVIDTSRQATADALPKTVSMEQMNMTLRQALPLLAGCAGAGVAFFVFFLLYGCHARLAFVFAGALLAAGIGTGYVLSGKTEATPHTTVRNTHVFFAPSRAARTLFTLTPGSTVTPLETTGTWIRIDASGRRGWIPSETLSDNGAAPAVHK